MNTLSLSYLIQKNYLLKKEKNIYVKHLDIGDEHSVLSETTKTGCAGFKFPLSWRDCHDGGVMAQLTCAIVSGRCSGILGETI